MLFRSPFTQEQLEEYTKCAASPMYFIKKYFKINTLDGGIIQFKPYKFQEKLIKLMHNERWIVGKVLRQAGKCVNYATVVQIRNKKTGEIKSIQIGELFDQMKED